MARIVSLSIESDAGPMTAELRRMKVGERETVLRKHGDLDTKPVHERARVIKEILAEYIIQNIEPAGEQEMDIPWKDLKLADRVTWLTNLDSDQYDLLTKQMEVMSSSEKKPDATSLPQ